MNIIYRLITSSSKMEGDGVKGWMGGAVTLASHELQIIKSNENLVQHANHNIWIVIVWLKTYYSYVVIYNSSTFHLFLFTFFQKIVATCFVPKLKEILSHCISFFIATWTLINTVQWIPCISYKVKIIL